MSATSHPIEPEEVMAYLDGELPLDRAATAATHLERCADCRAIAADLQSASQRLMAWQVEPSDPRITPALAAALAQRASRRQGWREVVKRPWFWPLAAAAVAVLVMVPVRRTREHSLANQSFSIDGLLQPDTNGQLQPDNAPTAAKLPVDALEPASPMIARTAALNLVTPEFDRTRAALEDILKRHHGYVATLNLAAPDGSGRTLTAAVRVPAAELEAAIAELKKLGRVESEQRSGEEITHQYVDLEARLANARHTEQLLTDLLRQKPASSPTFWRWRWRLAASAATSNAWRPN